MDETKELNEIESKEVQEELPSPPEVEDEIIPDDTDGETEDEERNAQARVNALREEIASLEGELERKRAETDKAAREYSEFRELYPDTDIESLPSEVIESVDAGIPLAAAYALYEKRLKKHNSDVAAHNKSTRADSFGSVGKAAESDYFTPDEVRAMTQGEVRANYSKILKSMKSWH